MIVISAKNKAYNMLMNAQALHQGYAANSEAIKQAEAVLAIAPIHLQQYWKEVLFELSKINC